MFGFHAVFVWVKPEQIGVMDMGMYKTWFYDNKFWTNVLHIKGTVVY